MMHAHKGVFWGIDKYPFGYKVVQIFPVLTPLILIKEICFLILNCPSFENDAISRFFNLCHGMFFGKPKRKILLFPEMRVTRKIYRAAANLFF